MPIIVRIRQNSVRLPGIRNCHTGYESYGNTNTTTTRDNQVRVSLKACNSVRTLGSAFERDNHAILTHVLTCDGLRQWVFYSSDLQESAHRINDVLPHDEPYPIELTADSDAEWSEYLDTLRSSGF